MLGSDPVFMNNSTSNEVNICDITLPGTPFRKYDSDHHNGREKATSTNE